MKIVRCLWCGRRRRWCCSGSLHSAGAETRGSEAGLALPGVLAGLTGERSTGIVGVLGPKMTEQFDFGGC